MTEKNLCRREIAQSTKLNVMYLFKYINRRMIIPYFNRWCVSVPVTFMLRKIMQFIVLATMGYWPSHQYLRTVVRCCLDVSVMATPEGCLACRCPCRWRSRRLRAAGLVQTSWLSMGSLLPRAVCLTVFPWQPYVDMCMLTPRYLCWSRCWISTCCRPPYAILHPYLVRLSPDQGLSYRLIIKVYMTLIFIVCEYSLGTLTLSYALCCWSQLVSSIWNTHAMSPGNLMIWHCYIACVFHVNIRLCVVLERSNRSLIRIDSWCCFHGPTPGFV